MIITAAVRGSTKLKYKGVKKYSYRHKNAVQEYQSGKYEAVQEQQDGKYEAVHNWDMKKYQLNRIHLPHHNPN